MAVPPRSTPATTSTVISSRQMFIGQLSRPCRTSDPIRGLCVADSWTNPGLPVGRLCDAYEATDSLPDSEAECDRNGAAGGRGVGRMLHWEMVEVKNRPCFAWGEG